MLATARARRTSTSRRRTKRITRARSNHADVERSANVAARASMHGMSAMLTARAHGEPTALQTNAARPAWATASKTTPAAPRTPGSRRAPATAIATQRSRGLRRDGCVSPLSRPLSTIHDALGRSEVARLGSGRYGADRTHGPGPSVKGHSERSRGRFAGGFPARRHGAPPFNWSTPRESPFPRIA